MSEVILLQVEAQEVQVIPSALHEYVMTTEQAALGYGVTPENIRQHKATKREELLEGKHWITVSNPNGGADLTYWTKRGVIRLGFFIRSKRARLFRDKAEELVVREVEAPAASPLALSRLMLESLEQQDARVTALEAWRDQSPITSERVGTIHRLGQQLGQLMGNYGRAWRLFNDHFGIASYRDLPTYRFEDAVRFLRVQIAAYTGTALLDVNA